ncbi:MAG TPA: hypothetical protein VFN10_03945, partial [Thermoanaerobaculia bacterium]|nr:hypothetical protein [Thermoanaerobaculia bacterium]
PSGADPAGEGARRSNVVPSALLYVEPLLFTLAFAAGLALEYPAVLRHSLFRVARNATVLQATIGTIVIVLVLAALAGVYRAQLRGALIATLTFALIVVAAWRMPFLPAYGSHDEAHANGVVIFGIDSLSQRDDVAPLRALANQHHGTWYETAITPALVTNAVWSSILTQRLPHESGVYLIYQDADWSHAPYNLVADAHRRGYETWSFFSSQFTSYLGSHAGFDRDESSPLGWLYISTGFVKDSSIFLPLLLPRLPHLPFATSPANQEGTFAYDLQQNVRDILTAGDGSRPAFVAAHLDYLHAYGYPRYRDLGANGARIVRHARVDALQDQSLDPDMPQIEGDPLQLASWKVAHIQRVLADELEATHFFTKNNRLVVLSDHGPRKGLGATNFGHPQFCHVVLLTFGMPSRDPRAPISLTDIPALIGWPAPDRKKPTPPIVEHAAVLPEEAIVLQSSIASGKRGAGLKPDGTIVLDPLVVRAVGQRLSAYLPFGPMRGYWRIVNGGRLVPLTPPAQAPPADRR